MSVDPTILKELVAMSDGDAWYKADHLVDLFPIEEWGEADGGTTTGLGVVFAEYEDVLRRDHGVEWSASEMRRQRATAVKWPAGARAPGTSYTVHRMIRGADRAVQMQKYLRMAEREGFALTKTMLSRFRTDEKPKKPLPPLDEQIRRRIGSALKSLILGSRAINRDDWWTHGGISRETRAIAADVLRRFADEIAP